MKDNGKIIIEKDKEYQLIILFNFFNEKLSQNIKNKILTFSNGDNYEG